MVELKNPTVCFMKSRSAIGGTLNKLQIPALSLFFVYIVEARIRAKLSGMSGLFRHFVNILDQDSPSQPHNNVGIIVTIKQ